MGITHGNHESDDWDTPVYPAASPELTELKCIIQKSDVSLQGGNQLLAPLLTKEETDWDVI